MDAQMNGHQIDHYARQVATRDAMLICEGPCSHVGSEKYTRHDYYGLRGNFTEGAMLPELDSVAVLFQCEECGTTRKWGQLASGE